MGKINICGYELNAEQTEQKTIYTTKKGKVEWETTPNQQGNKPAQDIVVIEATRKAIKKKSKDETKSFRKEKDIFITLKKALDWVENKKLEVEEDKLVTKTIKKEKEVLGITEKTEEIQEVKVRPSHQFQPGQSGNPAGKPKGARNKFLTKALIKELNKVYGKVQKADGTTEEITYFEEIIRNTIKKSISGDIKHTAHLWDRVEGKPKEEKEVSLVDLRELQDEEYTELDDLIDYADNESNQ